MCARVDHDLKDKPADDQAVAVANFRHGKALVDHLNAFPDRRAINAVWHGDEVFLAGQQMCLAAQGLGIRACWIGYLDIAAAGRILRLPDEVACVYLLPMGYPAEEPKPAERKSFDEVVFRDRWGGQ
jgi:nitroreductase